MKLIKRVYDKKEDHMEILQYLKKTISKPKGGVSVPLKEAIFGEKYWKATWFCITFIMFGQFTGVNAIMWYSNSIIKRMYDEGGGISPRVGTILIGFATWIGALTAMFPAKKFGRRTLVFTGHCLMGVMLILVGVFSYKLYNNAALAMILLFLITYQLSDGSITYLYVAEVVVDGALGFCFLALKGTALIISLTTEFIMDSPLHPYGAFWLYGGLASIGAVFIFFTMRETKGLSDKEKKELYFHPKIQS